MHVELQNEQWKCLLLQKHITIILRELPRILWYCPLSCWFTCSVIQAVSMSLRIVSGFMCLYISLHSHLSPGGTMGTSLGEMQRNCSQTKAKQAASWYGRARVNLATSSSQFSPMRRNMKMWTARPRSPMLWYATRWGNSAQALNIQKPKIGQEDFVD